MQDEGLENQENVEEFVELTQEELAKEYNQGTVLDGETPEENTTETPQVTNSSIPLSTDELEVYKEFIGEDIDESFFKDEDGKFLDKKSALTKLNKKISVASQNSIVNDPFINRYLTAKKNEGFNEKAFIKSLNEQVSVADMDSKKFLKLYYKNLDKGYTEDQINEFLKSKSQIELDHEAEVRKREYMNSIEENTKKNFETLINSRKQELESVNSSISSSIEQYVFDEIKNGKFPLKFAESDAEEMNSVLKDLFKTDIVIENGVPYETTRFESFLENPEKLNQILPFIYLAEKGKLNDFLKGSMNSIKDKEFEKIDSGNSLGTGGSKSNGTNWAKFMGKQ